MPLKKNNNKTILKNTPMKVDILATTSAAKPFLRNQIEKTMNIQHIKDLVRVSRVQVTNNKIYM